MFGSANKSLVDFANKFIKRHRFSIGMIDTKETKDMNYERAKVFLEKELKVHISKKTGTYLNGVIVEVSAEFFFIEDQKNGKELVFFSELKKPIETYTEVTDDLSKM